MRAPHPDLIGGGVVQQTFRMGEKHLYAGAKLTREQIVRMPAQNRNSLIETGRIMVWPRDATAAQDAESQCFVAPLGFGRYNVIQGRKLNDAPLNREEAHRLAGLPLPGAEAEKN
jgi:hypothetical protein